MDLRTMPLLVVVTAAAVAWGALVGAAGYWLEVAKREGQG